MFRVFCIAITNIFGIILQKANLVPTIDQEEGSAGLSGFQLQGMKRVGAIAHHLGL